MSKKTIEAYIPDSLGLIETHLLNATSQSVPKVYKGYISSMGATMNKAGLLPTLAIFSAPQSDSSEGDKRKLMRILTELLKGQFEDRYGTIEDVDNANESEDRLLRFAVDFKQNPQVLRQIKRDLTNASIAVKLTLRTFNLQ